MKHMSVMVAAVLMVLVMVTAAAANPFTDLKPSHWAYDAVKTLVEKGIMTGMPGGTFQGQNKVTRYEVAVCLARTLEQGGALSPADEEEIDRLVDEFSDELALLGVRVTAMEDSVMQVQDDIEMLKSGFGGMHHHGSPGKIELSGDAWMHMDSLKYENDTSDDNLNSYYQIGINLKGSIADKISTYIRVLNDELVGGEAGENIQGSAMTISQAYIDVRDLFEFADVRLGRQFVKIGHSIALDSKLDAIMIEKDFDKAGIVFIAGDQADNVTVEDGYNLKGLDVTYELDEHRAEMYYFVNNQTASDLVSYGFVMDGGLLENVDYFVEYGKYDPDTAAKGNIWLAGIDVDLVEDVDITFMYGKGDEEYQPIAAVYYWNRFNDMFGNVPAGAMPEGRTAASGSLTGIKDALIKIGAELNEKTSGCIIHEKVSANDTSAVIGNAREYKRTTFGVEHQYAPNTVLGLRFDTLEFDENNINDAQDAGGWNRVRLDMRVKF